MSMKPGATTSPVASISRLADPGSERPTATMRSPRTATSPRNHGLPVPSTTVPWRRSRSYSGSAADPGAANATSAVIHTKRIAVSEWRSDSFSDASQKRLRKRFCEALRTEALNPNEDAPPLHPVQDQPQHQQHHDAGGDRFVGGAPGPELLRRDRARVGQVEQHAERRAQGPEDFPPQVRLERIDGEGDEQVRHDVGGDRVHADDAQRE